MIFVSNLITASPVPLVNSFLIRQAPHEPVELSFLEDCLFSWVRYNMKPLCPGLTVFTS